MRIFTTSMFAVPAPAFAEVSDKMASVQELWGQGVFLAVLFLLLLRWSYWFSLLAVPVIVIFGIAAYATFADPYVGHAILSEQGTPYVIASYGSVVLTIVGFIIGLALKRNSKRHAT